jgi:hypothetical protein
MGTKNTAIEIVDGKVVTEFNKNEKTVAKVEKMKNKK